jgi:hypothetical protein
MEKGVGRPLENGKPLALENARLGFTVLADLVALVSQEIYSRFNIMLTANSIIIAAVVLALTSEHQLPQPLSQLLPAVGILLCIVWWLFNHHGVYWQTVFRREAHRLEQEHFSDTFKIWSVVLSASEDVRVSGTSEGPRRHSVSHPRLIRWFPYHRTSAIVILVFAVVHVVILIVATFN